MTIFKKEKFYLGVFLVVLLAVNPPVLNIINNYARENLLTFGYPTVWVWLTFWYTVAMVVFLIGAFLLPAWNKPKYKEGDIK